jgi:hypothetical protein
MVATPYVTWCRLELNKLGGSPGLFDRFDIARSYVEQRGWEKDEDVEDIMGYFVRIGLVSPQAFALDAYDRGEPGDTYSLVIYSLVPRFFWRDKPIISYGTEFNRAVTGRANNATLPGFFGEAYWNFGWTGVVLTCAYVGILYAAFTRIVVGSMDANDFRILPLAFFGFHSGARIEEWFAAGYVNGIPICVVYSLLIYRVSRAISEER